MAIEWSVSTLGEPEWGVDEFLELCGEFGLTGLELRFLNGSLDVGAEMKAYLADPEKVKKLAASGVRFPVMGSSLEIGKGGDKEFEEFIQSALVADRIGAQWLRVFDGPVWGENIGEAEKKNAKTIVNAWNDWRATNSVKVRMALETHGASSSSKVLEAFLDAVGEPVDIIWDVHHTRLVAGESFEETWERLGKRIVHVHIKDSVPLPSARHMYTLTLPGQGKLDGCGFISFLKDKGYDGFVSLEWEKKWHPYLPPLREAVAALKISGWKG